MGTLFDLAGKTALVTGASTGLGLAMAEGLVASGARVVIAGRGAEALETAAAELRAAHPGAEILCRSVDLYDRDSIAAFIHTVLADTGGIDIFVGNAGAVHEELIGSITHAEVDRVLQLNLTANIMLTQAFVPHMQAQRWGRIIYSSSTASALAAPFRGNLVYAASKSGLNGFARGITSDLGRDGITVNCIVLGVFWTSILTNAMQHLTETEGKASADALISGFTEMTALGRLGDPADLHGLVQLLASDAGRYITGTSIPIDGGTSIMMLPLAMQN